MSAVGKWIGISPKGSQMSAEDSAQEDKIQEALDKSYGTPGTFGQRKISADDAENALRAQGVLPQGWRLRESDSTSSGFRPTQAATKKMAAGRIGQVAAAVGTGGLSLPVQAAIQGGLGAYTGAQGGGGLKGALLGGAIGAGGAMVPGVGGALAKKVPLQAGLGAASALAQGGDWKSALIGGGFGAAGAGLGKLAPSLTSNPLAQKAINFGANTGLNTARTGQFNPLQTALGAGDTFLPNFSTSITSNPAAQRAINFGGQQGLNFAGGRGFNPAQLATGAIGIGNPNLAGRIQNNPAFTGAQSLLHGLNFGAGGPPVTLG